jgi:TIGR03009 family protein
MFEEDESMTRRIGCSVGVMLLLLPSIARAQASKSKSPPPPFQLTAEEEKSVDRVLDRWEQWNSRAKTFDCRFKRWVYDVAFGPPDQPRFVDLGTIKYTAPDRVLYRIDTMEKDGKELPIEDSRAQHWICDGKSIWQYDPQQKKVKETKLPPELPASRLVDGPLSFYFPVAFLSKMIAYWQPGPLSPATPFPFAAKAEELKQQYYIREVTPADQRNQVWLEAIPRPEKSVARLCHKLVLILNARDMSPFALRIVDVNGKDYKVYQFYDIVVNGPASRAVAASRPAVPFGWQMVLDDSPPPAAKRSGQGQ